MYMPANSPTSQRRDGAFDGIASVVAPSAHDDAPQAPRSTSSCRVSLEHRPDLVWIRLRPNCPCTFTRELLRELRGLQEDIAAHARCSPRPPRYQVLSTQLAGVFSLGGDLALIHGCIRRQDPVTLRRYAREAVDLVHANATGYGLPITTIAVVRGRALGGGFEAALANDVLVAERGSRMGLPEVLFNMFPGMGAFQLLCRRLGPAEAERLILGGRTYTAEELHAIGVVDVLAEEGDGEAAARRWIRANDRQHHARSGLRRALAAAAPLEREVLYRMADVWVETALDLGERDLDTIAYLLRAQGRLSAGSIPGPALSPEALGV
jgi:DSF synthase